MKHRGKLLLFIYLLFAGAAFGQPAAIDSLLRQLPAARGNERLHLLNELTKKHIRVDSARALHYAAEAHQLALQLKSTKGRVTSYLNKGHIYSYYHDYSNALRFYNKALLFAGENNLKTEEGRALHSIGVVYDEKGEFDKALKHYFKAIETCEAAGNKVTLAKSYNNVAVIYSLKNSFDKAIEYNNKSIKIKQELKDYQGIGLGYSSLGFMYFCQKNYNDALDYYQKAAAIAEKVKDKETLTRSLLGIGEVFHKKNQPGKALKHLLRAQQLAETSKNKINLIYAYNLLGPVYIGLNKKDTGLSCLKKSLTLAAKTGTAFEVLQVYKNLYEAHKKLNNVNEALRYHELVWHISDSLEQAQQNVQIIELQAKYEDEKRSKQIAILKKERGEAEFKANRQAAMRNYMLVTLFLLTIIGGLLFRMYKSKKKANEWLEHLVKERTNQLETKNHEKEIMLKEIHHRVKNNLQLISSLISLQLHYKGQKESEELLRICQHRIKCMALIHDKLYKAEELSGISVQEYFTELSNFIAEGYVKGNTEVKMKLDVPEIKLPIDKMIPCGLILNELVSNSLKYGFQENHCGQIGITLSQNDNRYNLTIEDNGIGLPENLDFNNLESLGLTLVHDLVDQLDGKILIKNDFGTKINISFPS